MKDILSLVQLQDFMWIIGLLVIVITSLVQALSKRYNPWLWLLEKLGDAMNKKMLINQDCLEKKVDLCF